MASPRDWFAEMRRRRVVRDALVYVAAVWALSQGVAQLGPPFGMPDWTTRWFVIACAIGFPFWLLFVWYYELTPRGIRREPDAASEDPATRRSRRKFDYWIFAAMAVAIVLLATNQFVLRRDATGRANAADTEAYSTALAGVPDRSVAVLPFANDSGDTRQNYFSDGLSEQLISGLTQIDGLRVIGKTSSFQFRGSKAGPAEIGAKLGAAHLIEGSVLRDGQRLRVVVNMVDARDGASLWSHTYDQELKDIFAVQSRIGEAVAEALKVKLRIAPGAAVQNEQPPGGNAAAYVAYLRGLSADNRDSESGQHEAIAAYEEARRLDPRYAAAHARLSLAWTGLAMKYLEGAAAAEGFAMARESANTALALDPDSSLAHHARADLLVNADLDWTGGEAEARRALQLAPNNVEAKRMLSTTLAELGKNRNAVDLMRQVLENDPRQAAWHRWLSSYLIALGELDEAEAAMHNAIALEPGVDDYYLELAVIAILRGDAGSALTAAQQAPSGIWRNVAVAMALQVGPDRPAADAALRQLVAGQGGKTAYQIARVYAVRGDPDMMFEWLDRTWIRRDPDVGHLLYDPLVLRYRNDPRFAAFCLKAGLPTVTDAKVTL